MLAIVAPGQGAQTPGFLSPWLELPGMPERFAAWSTVTGIDLVRLGTTAGAEEIRDTAVAQPLLVSASMAAAYALFGDLADAPETVNVAAGHSVGEFAAAAIAGTLSDRDALTLIRERAQGMAAASAVTETGMTAILGGDRDEVLAALDKHGLTPANDNGPGQIVAAGTMAQLAAFAEDPPAKARLRPLSVAGAFHTHHMEPAAERLRTAAGAVTANDPATRLLSDRDGAVVTSGAEYLDRLVAQVSSPVRWDACMETMTGLGVTALIELPPAGTLTGIARRAMRGVEQLALKTPDDLDAARALIAGHSETKEA